VEQGFSVFTTISLVIFYKCVPQAPARLRTYPECPLRPLCCVLSDILETVKEDDVAMLVLFNLSAAFDYAILLRRLHLSYGFDGTVLHVFES